MSWSKSAKGKRQDVKGAVSKWADEQAVTDAGMTQPAIDGHRNQVEASANAIGALCDTLPDHVDVSVSAWGHHNGQDASHSGGLSVSYSVPTPV